MARQQPGGGGRAGPIDGHIQPGLAHAPQQGLKQGFASAKQPFTGRYLRQKTVRFEHNRRREPQGGQRGTMQGGSFVGRITLEQQQLRQQRERTGHALPRRHPGRLRGHIGHQDTASPRSGRAGQCQRRRHAFRNTAVDAIERQGGTNQSDPEHGRQSRESRQKGKKTGEKSPEQTVARAGWPAWVLP